MASAVAQLGSLLESLSARVNALEKAAGLPSGASASGGASGGAGAAVDDEPTSTTREFDALVAKFGDEIAKTGATLGAEIGLLVRLSQVASRTAKANRLGGAFRQREKSARRACGMSASVHAKMRQDLASMRRN